jgi:type I restriction-modification system DNA methylase subunit
VLDCPAGTFQGAGVKTVVLFFEKGTKTRKIWYYQLDPGRNLGKTNPLNDGDLADFIDKQKTFADSDKSWSVDAAHTLSTAEVDLSVKNPNGGEVIVHRSPQEIMDEIAALDTESAEVLENIKRSLRASKGAETKRGWQIHLDFFGYMLVVIEDAIREAGEGCGGQTELARSVLAERFSVSYPESMDEQQRIVALLDEAFAEKRRLAAIYERKLAAVEELKKSLLHQAFSGEL